MQSVLIIKKNLKRMIEKHQIYSFESCPVQLPIVSIRLGYRKLREIHTFNK